MKLFSSALILGVAAGGVVLAGLASASSTYCTSEPQSKWMSMDAMRSKVEAMGYKIREFEVDDGCYEIEGTNTKGQKVEVYFHPVTGNVVKSELDD